MRQVPGEALQGCHHLAPGAGEGGGGAAG
jgi:hypothetical protein